MHERQHEVEARLRRTLDERLRPAIHPTVAALTVEVWRVPPADDGLVGDPVGYDVARAAPYEPAQVGLAWGPPWSTTWFRVSGEVPAGLDDAEAVLDLGFTQAQPGFQAEGLVHDPEGRVVKGLNPLNDWVPVPNSPPGGHVEWYVEAAANPTVLTGFRPTLLGDRATSGDVPLYRLARADLCRRETAVADLVADLEVADGVRRSLPDDHRARELLDAVERALDALDLADVTGTAARARAELAGVLGSRAAPGGHVVSAVGHAHIDSAWLWPLRETVRKVARTVANVVQLMDSDDSLVYAMSSAQQWAWLEASYPELFARVRTYVDQGRFVPVGGMWVESDTNLVGGEAMARQLVLGKRWFAEHLGVEPREVWLPDSFGYTAALPQIVDLAGMRWFLTQKISWNTTNPFPHHTFWWEGIDGTRVFTHFPPVDTYNAELSGEELAHSAANFRDRGSASRALVPFGYGDGGGGPTREMLARARRTADLDGSPRVRIESPADFFAAAEEEYADRAPVWAGELYLEIHRGTYTSQAAMKAGNRRCEHLLREAELWSATAAVRGLLEYPYEALRAAWETVLLHQFHDILPGSSIAWVHREARATYDRVSADLEAVIGRALDALAGPGEETVAFNAAPLARLGVPALGAGTAEDERLVSTAWPSAEGGAGLESDYFRVRVDADGVIRSIVDLRHDREALPPGGAANLLELHPDHPNRWDAWDLDEHYRHTVVPLTAAEEVRVDGDAVVVRRSFGDSSVAQRISLHLGRIEVDTEVDWHESDRVLKLAVDCDVHADEARYETQFGHVVRPTHVNTSWDAARFEVCAHRWAMVAEPGYGVALANHTTYGHDVSRHPRKGGGTYSRIRASLLRAPRFPDPVTDQGRHRFRHAIVPGADVAGAARAGYGLNLPLRRRPGRAVEPLVAVTGAPAYVEAVKLAEDGSDDVVVRLYEPLGARARVRVTPSFQTSGADVVDLLERPRAGLAVWDGEELELRPFQIVTLRFRR
ncbi:MAG TPA: glycoside hydrolase family 38 C-terminal domain-containing protein [Nocardioides sp.]|jgi:alpha-mannosidase|uniref:alpha-mannosidase n=1 Tax=Nocardioides sp. TaxID=35761 RepID=UPI002E31FE3F|nr:glycoside hydrolase family 38 C-terminal domain-containing protein [Nocardioides sp.]HEX3932023.1 glycoside hydrolase family 38 C-terminal domain-containing protein [Nocardioides sp.]